MKLFLKRLVTTGKVLGGILGASVTTATIVFGFLDYTPKIIKAFDDTESIRISGNNCLTRARKSMIEGNFAQAKIAYGCAEEKFSKAADSGDARAFYGLALTYADDGVHDFLDIEEGKIGFLALDNWCEARRRGFSPASINPPFMRKFPELYGRDGCH